MGNCVRKGSVGHWTDDEWDSPETETSITNGGNPSELLLKLQIERKMLVVNKKEVGVSTDSKKAQQMKIKMTRRELEELLGGKGNEGGLWTELKAALRKDRSEEEHGRRRSYDTWRPSLECIEEVE